MRHDFYAYMDRMKYIKRWQLMRSMRDENIMEHSQEVFTCTFAPTSMPLSLAFFQSFFAVSPGPTTERE